MAHNTVTVELTSEDSNVVYLMLLDRIKAHKNWIVGAVRERDFDYAVNLAKEMETYEILLFKFKKNAPPAKKEV